MSDNKPSPYSHTDSTERDSIKLLESLLDSQRFKPHLDKNDKTPNHDGEIELVDEKSYPLGKIQVQVKTMGKGAKSFSCKSPYVGYSDVTLSPFILVCTDNESGKAYWKHLHSHMPEYKPNQNSFTIYFTDEDRIDSTSAHYERWLRLIQDRKKKIDCFHIIAKENNDKIGLSGVSSEKIAYFQIFVDEINSLLDCSFSALKSLLFPLAWKIGVAIHEDSIATNSYSLFLIPQGLAHPMVIKEDKAPSLWNDTDNSPFRRIQVSDYYGDTPEDPKDPAKKFIEKELKEAIQKRSFRIYSQELSTELLLYTLWKHGDLLGIEPKTEYEVTELTKLFYQDIPRNSGVKNLEDAKRFYETAIFFTYSPPEPILKEPFLLKSFMDRTTLSLATVVDALEFLVSQKIKTIKSPLKEPSAIPKTGGSWVWDGYTKDEDSFNVRYLLTQSLKEYRSFIKGNRFSIPDSPYLDFETCIYFHFFRGSDGKPFLHEYHIGNKDLKLPKLIIQTYDESGYEIKLPSRFRPEIIINSEQYQLSHTSHSLNAGPFKRTPLHNLVYDYFCSDLERCYGFKIRSENI